MELVSGIGETFITPVEEKKFDNYSFPIALSGSCENAGSALLIESSLLFDQKGRETLISIQNSPTTLGMTANFPSKLPIFSPQENQFDTRRLTT